MKRFLSSLILLFAFICGVSAADTFVTFLSQANVVTAPSGTVTVDAKDYPGVLRAVEHLRADMQAACGRELNVTVGSLQNSQYIKDLVKRGQLNKKELLGKVEKYIIDVREDGQIIIAGSDKRGTIYGIYELSRQLGVSPWYWFADMPIIRREQVFLTPGQYTDGEPVVRYRGIFLNDEAPCLSNWVREKFPDAECPGANPKLAHGFNHHFYERVFELLQRLRANYLWPAMWGNAFYADDSLNSTLADEMGIIMGTSHHEPMARNHQEWARHRKENGPWDYVTNQKVIDQFFREGVRRSKNNEDIITIGMRGDGDAAMGGQEGNDKAFVRNDEFYIKLYEKIFRNQRQIIKEETGKPAAQRPQLWALYKEVQRYYELGLTVPEDVIILLCDDNWGNIRRVPTVPHKGGFGMYYHVDYVGAPRCTKWANVTPIAHLWEQMELCVNYGIDKLWILNVGDLKPMEQPIDFFLEMAWDPKKFENPASIHQQTERFAQQILGEVPQNLTTSKPQDLTTSKPQDLTTSKPHNLKTSQPHNLKTSQVSDLIRRYGVLNGRVTPEMLSPRTYNLETGEWAQVVNEYKALEADALRLYLQLQSDPATAQMDLTAVRKANNPISAYYQLVLFPIQSMCNLYEMYYALAQGDQTRVNYHFDRDSLLCAEYHHLNGGKWNHLMREPHIGYRSWNGPQHNIRPQVRETKPLENIFRANGAGYIAIEAEHYYKASNTADGQWTVIPAMGRTLSAVELLPHNASTEGASITYAFEMPAGVKAEDVKVHVISNSTLPFYRAEGHRYQLSLDGGAPVEVNYNGRYNEDNQWEMYDIVATRVIETVTPLRPQDLTTHTLTITPVDPGLCLEKVVIDFGGYQRQHLFGTESPRR